MNTKYMNMCFSVIALTGAACCIGIVPSQRDPSLIAAQEESAMLLTAAKSGDYQGVMNTLNGTGNQWQAKANINARDNNGNTALILAANISQLNPNFINKIKIINALLNHTNAQGKKDILVDAINKDGWTALMFAASQQGSFKTVNALIQAGANINTKGNDNSTPLSLAIGSNSTISAVDLLNNSASTCNLSDSEKQTLQTWFQKPMPTCKTSTRMTTSMGMTGRFGGG